MSLEFKDFVIKSLNLKDSEEFFGIRSQPENACPLADDLILILEANEQKLYTLKEKIVRIPTIQTSDKKTYLFYVSQIDNALEVISSNIGIIDDIKTEIEFWRSRCLAVRVMFKRQKTEFWSSLILKEKQQKEYNKIQPYELDRSVSFDIAEIIFNKYESNCSFFHENFAFLDFEGSFISLDGLKQTYLDLFEWGNQLTEKMKEYSSSYKDYNLFLDDKCLPDSRGNIAVDSKIIDPSREYICFNNVHSAMDYILKNGIPSFVSIDKDMGENNVDGKVLISFIKDHIAKYHLSEDFVNYQTH